MYYGTRKIKVNGIAQKIVKYTNIYEKKENNSWFGLHLVNIFKNTNIINNILEKVSKIKSIDSKNTNKIYDNRIELNNKHNNITNEYIELTYI